MQLAHLGADVIKIETRTRPCVTRQLPPWPDAQAGGLNRSGYFNQYSQGKRSVSLNFKEPAAHEIARKIIAQSDVVINNFAHGVIEKMGFGYEAVKQIKPDIIMISLTGYGDSGPYADYIAYGPAQVPLIGTIIADGLSRLAADACGLQLCRSECGNSRRVCNTHCTCTIATRPARDSTSI